MTMTTDTQHMLTGKVRKVTSLRTSDEVRRERWREKQEKKKRAMLLAVEQAVALPEPLPKVIVTEEVVTEVAPAQPMEMPQEKLLQKGRIGHVLESIGSLMDRMRILVLEEER